MRRDWYDTAQICLGGHVITERAESDPESTRKFCRDCGEKTIKNCAECNEKIPGHHHLENAFINVIGILPTAPRYCEDCGSPYPWTKSRIAVLKESLAELEMEEAEKAKLQETVNDLVRETPRTELAAGRFRRIFDKIKPEHKEMVKNMALKVICESAKKLIFGEM